MPPLDWLCSYDTHHQRVHMTADLSQTSAIINEITPPIHEVVCYIDDHLDERLTLDALCQVAGVSKYHFHRQFSQSCGMPLYQYIQERRLQMAATLLANRSEQSVIEVSLACGFSSAEGFSRAFAQRFAQSPSSFRRVPDWSAVSLERPNFQPIRNYVMQHTIDVSVIDFQPVAIMTLTHRGSPWSLQSSIDAFIQWRRAHQLSPSKSRTFNILYNDPHDVTPEDYRVDLGVSVPDDFAPTDDQLQLSKIPGGRCAKVSYHGGEEGLRDVITYLYQQWLLESGEKLRDAPLFFERYPQGSAKPVTQIDICLPIG